MPQRIGDSERDQAAELLREHMAAGRLDQDEFDDRLGKALTARTSADLDPLFTDLPGPKPGNAVAPAANFTPPPWQSGSNITGNALTRPTPPAIRAVPDANRALAIIAAVVRPLTIMVCFIVGWQYWWLMFIPIMVSSIAGGSRAGTRAALGAELGLSHCPTIGAISGGGRPGPSGVGAFTSVTAMTRNA